MKAKAKDHIQTRLPNSYVDPRFNLETIKISPGQYYVTKQNILIVTAVASCVVVCLRERRKGIGGMSHFMLADEGRDYKKRDSLAYRSGAQVIDTMIEQFMEAGAETRYLEAKVFGGTVLTHQPTVFDRGAINTEFALNYLRSKKIKVVAKSLKGNCARKVYFFARSGRVLVRVIKKLNNKTLMNRESEYRKRLEASAARYR